MLDILGSSKKRKADSRVRGERVSFQISNNTKSSARCSYSLCNRPIGKGVQVIAPLKVQDYAFHRECAFCAGCQRPLNPSGQPAGRWDLYQNVYPIAEVNNGYASRGDPQGATRHLFYCEERCCGDKKCFQCRKPLNIPIWECVVKIINNEQMLYHPECHTCYVCGCEFTPGMVGIVSSEGRLFCQTDRSNASLHPPTSLPSEIMEKVGLEKSGSFCTVNQARLKSEYAELTADGLVALRRLSRQGHASDETTKRFNREMLRWFNLHRPRPEDPTHVIEVLGVVQENPRVWVLEWANGGTIIDYLKSRGTVDAHQPDFLRLLGQAAKGVEFLHTEQFIHGDIKADNILVCNNEAKISDFSLTKYAGQYTSTSMKASEPWCFRSPERLASGSGSDDHRTKASDIYAFGITIAQVVSLGELHKVWPIASANFEKTAVQNDFITKMQNPNYRPELPCNVNEAIRTLWDKIAERCWAHEPSRRWTAEQLRDKLVGLDFAANRPEKRRLPNL